jgi:hypothetical protein
MFVSGKGKEAPTSNNQCWFIQLTKNSQTNNRRWFIQFTSCRNSKNDMVLNCPIMKEKIEAPILGKNGRHIEAVFLI